MVLGEPNIYQNLGDLTRMGILLGGLSDCEELSGGYSQEMMGLVLEEGYGFICFPFTYLYLIFPFLSYSVRFHGFPFYPRPTKGILVAITVMKSTFASKGSPAM